MARERWRAILSLGLIVWISIAAVAKEEEQDKSTRVEQSLSIFNDVMRQLDINYVDTLNYEDLTETAISQMLRKIDPYTVYYPKKKDNDLKMMTTGKYGGIGAIIQMREVDKKKKEKQPIISNPYEGKPAQRNGLQAGDQILTIDGMSIKGKELSEVSNLLRGEPGSTIKLVIKRESNPKKMHFEFPREEIRIPPVSFYTVLKADTIETPIGYICLDEFTENAARDFTLALDNLKYKYNIGALIIDLRDNGGGLVDEAMRIVNLFVDKGTEVVSTKGKTAAATRSYKTTQSARYMDIPLVILVNKSSASASEIVSGSLQDLGRATLIGQRTFGKGLVQTVRPIAYGGHIKVTTSKYYLPSGRCIQAIDYSEQQKGKALKRDSAGGILPDIVMEDSAKIDICYALYLQNMFFDYATRYYNTHDSIAKAREFYPTDEDIDDFYTFLKEKEFSYQTETSKYFEEVINMARHEDLDSTTVQMLIGLKDQLTPNYQEAIERNKDKVKEMLGAEIVSRYYYQKGATAYGIRFDKELHRAISECNNKYRKQQKEDSSKTNQ